MTEDEIQERIDAYCRRYAVDERNAAGFPVFPAGRRETPQHREWIGLFKVFSRARRRSGGVAAPKPGSATCVVCGRPGDLASHPKCRSAVELVRALGGDSLDRLRAAALPDPEASPAPRKRKA
jgi:hypothetical protein